jgi:hypothetical protein
MKTNVSIRILLGSLVVLGGFSLSETAEPLPAAQDPQPVIIHLASGRSVAGTVAARTDDSTLWLLWRHGTIRVLRPIRWERVVRAELDGHVLSVAQFRQAVVRPEPLGSTSHETVAARSRTFSLRSLRSPISPVTESTPAISTPAAIMGSEPGADDALPVESLSIDAWVANWDGDVEVDGLVVEARPLDSRGAVTPVHGTLEVNLIGWRSGRTRSKQAPVRLGRWTQAMRPADFASLGTEYRFPFQSVHPDFDLRWAPRGTVHARLSVPGQGVFEATASTVRIRPYSALRDHLEVTTGQRFYPMERTGRGGR